MLDQITLIRAINPPRVCKAYALQNGVLAKTAVAHLTEGEAVTLSADTAQSLVQTLKKVTDGHDLVICPGVWQGAEVGQTFRCLSQKKLCSLLDLPEEEAPAGLVQHNGQPVGARLKHGIDPVSWLLLDADNPPGIPEHWAEMTIGQRLELMEAILPGISKAERIELRASSARVVKDGENPGNATHAWLRITHPELVPFLRAHVRVQMVIKDLSFSFPKKSRSTGEVVGHEHRTVFDLAVWDQGRLVFCAKPDVGNAPGYHVADAGITIVNEGAGPFDNAPYSKPPRSDDVGRMNKKAKTELVFDSNGSYSAQDHKSLKLDTPIEVKGVEKPLSEWVKEMKMGSKLRCEAPFRESSSEAAFIAFDGEGRPFVYDEGCKTSYRLCRTELALPSGNHSGEQPVLDERGRPMWCHQTAYATLANEQEWQGVLAYDELAGIVMLTKPIPGTKTPKSTFKHREFSDVDNSHATRWFNKNGFPRATKAVVMDAIVAAAHENIISPVRHYLEDLVWDGVARLERLFVTYFGAQDTEFNRAVGKAWAISAVARALDPGCKADHVPVLEGAQGAGKSTALRILAGDTWFHDSLGDLASKDAAAALRGKWIIELPELAAMRRTDIESTKAFLSRTTERYRPPYGRAEVIEPRRCVFVGTTNRQDWSADATGGRRFWPVVVGSVASEDLKRDRDQLWAEAVTLYRKGERWWLDREMEKSAAALVMDRSEDDPWAAEVLSYAERAAANASEVFAREILDQLGIERDRQTKRDAKRVGEILSRAGWVRGNKASRGQFRGLIPFQKASSQSGFPFDDTG
jgi:hypothetical protein